jgi:uncharacterized protein with HEPN domain
MSETPTDRGRLAFLLEIAAAERRHLLVSDSRVFSQSVSADRLATLESDIELAERIDAFVARFGRLQDTLGDKALPLLLRIVAEPIGTTLDNLDRAERFGWLASATDWLALRKLRNRLIHEYVRDIKELAEALNAAHAGVPVLCRFFDAISAYSATRLAIVVGIGEQDNKDR